MKVALLLVLLIGASCALPWWVPSGLGTQVDCADYSESSTCVEDCACKWVDCVSDNNATCTSGCIDSFKTCPEGATCGALAQCNDRVATALAFTFAGLVVGCVVCCVVLCACISLWISCACCAACTGAGIKTGSKNPGLRRRVVRILCCRKYEVVPAEEEGLEEETDL